LFTWNHKTRLLLVVPVPVVPVPVPPVPVPVPVLLYGSECQTAPESSEMRFLRLVADYRRLDERAIQISDKN
jgi:hypothetical protein